MLAARRGRNTAPAKRWSCGALYATSQQNDYTPGRSPRSYDADRDGLVVGEGAGMLVLEDLDHAVARAARASMPKWWASGCNSDGTRITRPEAATMRVAMEMALRDASLPPSAVGYVNGHGTATEQGDIAETWPAEAVFGAGMAISSQKSYLGHTLGACGARDPGSASKC